LQGNSPIHIGMLDVTTGAHAAPARPEPLQFKRMTESDQMPVGDISKGVLDSLKGGWGFNYRDGWHFGGPELAAGGDRGNGSAAEIALSYSRSSGAQECPDVLDSTSRCFS
jgi:hypothetical protein